MAQSEITILVPGFSDRASLLRPLERALRKKGIDAYVVSPQPSDGTVSIDVLAEELASEINALFPPTQPLNLFGFSMGGLVCRTYIQRLGGLGRTLRLVTLATPHQGTYAAYLYNRPACFQMRPGSQFLVGLNTDVDMLAQIYFVSIWTPLDLTILPPASSMLPIGEMAPILSPFHRTLVYDPRVVAVVTEHLRKPPPAAEQTNHATSGQAPQETMTHPAR
jgi:triacylglycerol lipase